MNKRDAREGRDLRETSPQKEHVVDFWIRLDFRAHAAPQDDTPAGCSKRPFSKAAASEDPRRTLRGTLRV